MVRLLCFFLIFMVFVVKKSLVICRFYINSRLCLLNNIRCRHDVLGSGDESLLAQVKIFLEEGPSYFKGLTSEEKETFSKRFRSLNSCEDPSYVYLGSGSVVSLRTDMLLGVFKNERKHFVKSMKAVWSCEGARDVKAAERFKNLLSSSVFSHLEFILNIPDMGYWKKKLSSVDWKKEDIVIDFDILFCFFLGEILKSLGKSFKNELVVPKDLEGFSYVLSTDVDFHIQSAWTSVCFSRAIDIIAAKLITVRGGRLKHFKDLCIREDGALGFPCENLDNRAIGKLTYYTIMLLRQKPQLLSNSVILWEGRSKSRRYFLFEVLGFEFFQRFKFPSLVPLKVDSSRVKGWRTSHGEIRFSSRSLKALEFSDSKAFFVNSDCLALFEKVLFDPAQDIKFVNDFPTVGGLEALKLEISCLEASIDIDRCFEYSKYKQALYAEGSLDKASARIHALAAFNLDEDTLAVYRKWMRRKALLKSLINRWREIFFQLSVAKELVGYPLYFTSYVDYRGRLYPNESCFGRTQGVLKHLVSGVEKFIELPAFLFFFEAYYASLPETDLKALLSQLKDILSLGLGREDTLKSFLYVFNQNPLHLDVRRHPYHTLVGIELGKALRCGSSGFLLELDQRSSGPALLGLLLGHKGLSDRAVFNTDAREYLVPFLQGHLHDWFRLARISLNGEGKSLFELFLVDKRFVKGCVLQLIYGQKGYGRWVFLEDLAIQVDSGYAHSKFFEMFRKLGFSFERLIDEVLPGLRSKISSLESICRIFAGSLKNFTIRLPDGTFISYRCVKYSHPSVKYGSKDPITGNVVRHRISFNEIKCIDKEASLRAAIPNLVQALDAWILREALYSLGKKGVTFNHVHDAFLLHCGDIDMFFSIIKDIYRKKFFKVSMDDIYISPNCDQLEQLVTKDVLDDISYYRDSVLSREPILYSAFDPSNCYKFK